MPPPLPGSQQIHNIINTAVNKLTEVGDTAIAEIREATTASVQPIEDAASAAREAVDAASRAGANLQRLAEGAIGDIRSAVDRAKRDLLGLLGEFVDMVSPEIVVANVNGMDITIEQQIIKLHDEIKRLIEAGTNPITVKIYGPYAVALADITKPQPELQQWVVQRMGLPRSTHILTPNLADWAIVTICIVIAVCYIATVLGGPAALATGILITCLAIALLIAVVHGRKISAKPCQRLQIGAVEIPVGWENCVEITIFA